MNNSKTVTVIISEDGAASIDLANFKGVGCAKVASDFLGDAKLISENVKPEYKQTAAIQQHNLEAKQ